MVKHEFHSIVEFSYNERKSIFIIRFLNGTCLRVPVENLPPKYRLKNADWEGAEKTKSNDGLIVFKGKKKITLPAYVLYSSGRII